MRSFGIRSSRSPAVVVSVRGREPLRWAVRFPCARAARRRSPRSAPPRSAPDTAPRSTSGCGHRRRQLSVPRAARAGQTGPGPSRGLSLSEPWREHAEHPRGGPSPASTSPTGAGPPISYTTSRDVTTVAAEVGPVRSTGEVLEKQVPPATPSTAGTGTPAVARAPGRLPRPRHRRDAADRLTMTSRVGQPRAAGLAGLAAPAGASRIGRGRPAGHGSPSFRSGTFGAYCRACPGPRLGCRVLAQWTPTGWRSPSRSRSRLASSSSSRMSPPCSRTSSVCR